MEKFFRVKEDSELYKDYFEHNKELEKVRKAYCNFADKNGIESDTYYAKSNLAIKPTKGDVEKFDEQFKKEIDENGLKWFKIKSPINKLWIEETKEIDFKKCSDYRYFNYNLPSGANRKFMYKDAMYGSIDYYKDWELPDYLEELTKADFYRLLADMSEQEK